MLVAAIHDSVLFASNPRESLSNRHWQIWAIKKETKNETEQNKKIGAFLQVMNLISLRFDSLTKSLFGSASSKTKQNIKKYIKT